MNPDNLEPSAKEPLERKYANYFQIGHNAHEIVLELGQLNEAEAAPRLHTAIVTTPAYAKTLLRLLEKALHAYEERFGAISETDQ